MYRLERNGAGTRGSYGRANERYGSRHQRSRHQNDQASDEEPDLRDSNVAQRG